MREIEGAREIEIERYGVREKEKERTKNRQTYKHVDRKTLKNKTDINQSFSPS